MICLDFSENYDFVEQDAIQGAHLNYQHCTLHPIVVYYLKEGEGKSKCFCYVSDDMKHDAAAVYSFVADKVKQLKEVSPNFRELIVWSENGPNHNKCRQNFANISLFFSEFGIKIKWMTFFTFHGRNSSYGVGGTEEIDQKIGFARQTDQLTSSILRSCNSKHSQLQICLY